MYSTVFYRMEIIRLCLLISLLFIIKLNISDIIQNQLNTQWLEAIFLCKVPYFTVETLQFTTVYPKISL